MKEASMGKCIQWLLEDSNPAVKYRTYTEILKQTEDRSQPKEWILSKLPENWYETRGLWYVYYLTALAECGLFGDDVPDVCFSMAFQRLDAGLDFGCENLMLLRAMVRLGFAENEAVKKAFGLMKDASLTDGGYLCQQRAKKLNYQSKSCYKADLHALLLLAECKKQGTDISFGDPLIDYFLRRDIFYKSNDRNSLVVLNREGWRTIDTFYPFETMRVGLQNVVEAFCALGYGNDPVLSESWQMLDALSDGDGKYVLKGSLTKSYLPKEKTDKPSKWVTFYALLAKDECL